MPLPAGTRLGPYEITGALGAGGMGEVYRARDTRLERTVAIKVLPAHRADTPEARQRFEREARAISALNHPNICHLYDVGNENGTAFLVMEYMEGQTLAERLARGPLATEQVLKIGMEICDALDKAHCAGFIHRDLKPANIMLTKTGAKLMDFGLAATAAGAGSSGMSVLPTMSKQLTAEGTILGTFQCMSPEQLEGREADSRSDIFALGAVIYEMATGRHAFEGKSQASVIGAILERQPPPISSVQPMAPRALDRVVKTCLAKDPDERWQTARDVKLQLQGIVEEGAVTASIPAVTPSTSPSRLKWAAVLLGLAVLAVALGLWWSARVKEPARAMQLSLELPVTLSGIYTGNPGCPFDISRDGSKVVFVGEEHNRPQLYIRQLDQQFASPIPGTDTEPIQPFFSPDGEWIAYFSAGKLRKVSVRGGPITILGDAPVPHGGSWSDDGWIIFGSGLGSGLVRVPENGGTPENLTVPNGKAQEVSHRWPQTLPGNQTVLFTIQLDSQVTYDNARVAALSLKDKTWKTLFTGGSYARYVPSGHIVYVRAGTLMAAPFDLKRLELTGPAVPVENGVLTSTNSSGGAQFAVTPAGTLMYVPGNSRPPDRLLMWVDRAGHATELHVPANNYGAPRISPTGKIAALQLQTDGVPTIWVYDFTRNTLSRLTFGTGVRTAPIWTPDGKRVLYRTVAEGFPAIRQKPADGSGSEEVVLRETDPAVTPFSISPDGKVLLFGKRGNEGAMGIYKANMEGGDRNAEPYLRSTYGTLAQAQAEFSPDGHWVAYSSNESGREEIYVQPFPGPGGKWIVSSDGGSVPRWSRSGREIFYRNADKMMSVEVQTQPTFQAGTPHVLFQGSYSITPYDVAPDSQHFLLVKDKEGQPEAREVKVVLNWVQELKRRVPAK